MSPSPKRHGMIVDVTASWPLPGTTSPSHPPSLTLSASSSNDNIDRMSPSTPVEEAAPSILLPGFHFSTADENVDAAEFHRIAAQLLSGESSKRDSSISGELLDYNQPRQLHCDLGKDPSGRYCCSCSKSYPTPSRLREHIAICAGTNQHPCPTCDRVFETKTKLDRHVSTRHNNNMEACPECGEHFPANFLPKHLACGFGGCDGMIQATTGPAPEVDKAYQYSSKLSPSQHFWIYDGDMSWQQFSKPARDSKLDNGEDDVTEQTMQYLQQLINRPGLRPNMEACGLCGELFSKEGDALAQHIGEHSIDFAEKRHRCDECRIYFANEKDLDRHLQSANLNRHCGFTFRHNSRTCTGHHPPTYYKTSIPNDHNLIQRHLWAWELSQLRLHRVTVARLLAERLTSPGQKHMSIQDCRRTYVSLLPHVSIANRDSMRSESGWIRDRRESEAAQLDAHFSKVLSEAFPEEDEEICTTIENADDALDVRPDSTIIPRDSTRDTKQFSKSKSFYDLARRKTPVIAAVKQQDHKRTQSGPINFLKQRASRELMRPHSLPLSTPAVSLAA